MEIPMSTTATQARLRNRSGETTRPLSGAQVRARAIAALEEAAAGILFAAVRADLPEPETEALYYGFALAHAAIARTSTRRRVSS
jgi:hypothetical protein